LKNGTIYMTNKLRNTSAMLLVSSGSKVGKYMFNKIMVLSSATQ